MPALVLKNIPVDLHRKLKLQAASNQRSMTRQAIILLQQGVESSPASDALALAIRPFKRKCLLTDALLKETRKGWHRK
jgi:plasmid stability protein